MTNRYHNYRRPISEKKFSRVFDQNLDNAGVAFIWVHDGQRMEVKNSIQACISEGYCYARFVVMKDDSMNTYCLRYSLEERVDFLNFIKYDTDVFKQVQF